MSIFRVASVHGSEMEDLKSKFHDWLAGLKSSIKTEKEKQKQRKSLFSK
jgi:hypothetical protein